MIAPHTVNRPYCSSDWFTFYTSLSFRTHLAKFLPRRRHLHKWLLTITDLLPRKELLRRDTLVDIVIVAADNYVLADCTAFDSDFLGYHFAPVWLCCCLLYSGFSYLFYFCSAILALLEGE